MKLLQKPLFVCPIQKSGVVTPMFMPGKLRTKRVEGTTRSRKLPSGFKVAIYISQLIAADDVALCASVVGGGSRKEGRVDDDEESRGTRSDIVK